MKLHLKVITPEKIYLDEDVDSLTIKLKSGVRTILPEHAALVGAVDYGSAHTVNDGVVSYYALHSGVIKVDEHGVVLVLNGIESADEIDEERAKQAKERALERIAHKEDPDIDVKRAQLALQRALARLAAYNREI